MESCNWYIGRINKETVSSRSPIFLGKRYTSCLYLPSGALNSSIKARACKVYIDVTKITPTSTTKGIANAVVSFAYILVRKLFIGHAFIFRFDPTRKRNFSRPNLSALQNATESN